MSQGVIRPLKGGGCSICKASPNNVGKKRCKHILDNATMTVVNKHDGLKTIDISGQVDGKNTTFSIAAAENDIKSYISNLSSGLSKKDKQNILAVLQNE